MQTPCKGLCSHGRWETRYTRRKVPVSFLIKLLVGITALFSSVASIVHMVILDSRAELT